MCRIEYTLLYSMLMEPSIFPPKAIFDVLDSESLDQYLYCRPPPQSCLKELPISYAQLTALLVLAGEEWTSESRVPKRLCDDIVNAIVKYAEDHNLDRKVETQELIDAVIKYSKKREDKIAFATVLPIYMGGIASAATANPIPFWITYLLSVAVNGRNISKEAVSEMNLSEMKENIGRAADVEKTSLIREAHD